MLTRSILCSLWSLVFGAAGLLAQSQGSLLNVQGNTAGGARQGGGKAPVVTMVSRGGFRWAQTEIVSIGEANGKPAITIERTGYEPGQQQGPTTKELTAAQNASVLRALRDNAALTLRTDRSLAGRFTDLPEYTFTLSLDGKSNTFIVLGPMMMEQSKPRYYRIFLALSELAEQALPAPQMQ